MGKVCYGLASLFRISLHNTLVSFQWTRREEFLLVFMALSLAVAPLRFFFRVLRADACVFQLSLSLFFRGDGY
jgi:hypothetical protein